MPRITGAYDLFAGTDYHGPGIVCGVCCRPLTNPTSVATGIGPICSGRGHPTKPKGLSMRADYTVSVVANVIVIIDSKTGKSVTNDVEEVVRDLRAKGFDLSLPVVYKDSMDMWSGIKVADGEFRAFYHLKAANQTEAIAAAKAQEPTVHGPM